MTFDDLPCPFCGSDDDSLTVSVRNGITMHCGSCGEDFDAGTARSHVEQLARLWAAVLDWCRDHPSNKAPRAKAGG